MRERENVTPTAAVSAKIINIQTLARCVPVRTDERRYEGGAGAAQFVFDRRVHALWDEKIVPSVNKELRHLNLCFVRFDL